jgi:hypothetical protein
MKKNLTGKNKDLSSNIAEFLTGEIKSLPSGETKPDADILIIVGQ